MKYHIAAAARMSDLSVDTIRAWERRYGIVHPERDTAGLRLYSDQDVARLSLARGATQLGHPIRKVAQMTNELLESLLRTASNDSRGLHEGVVDRVLAAITANDPGLAEQLLGSAALIVPTPDFVLAVLVPVLREVGDLWERGSVSVWQEHLFSTLIRNVAGAFPRPSSGGAAMLFATPPFEWHEFGIALAAMLASSRGRATYNLGPRVPLEEIADATRRLKPAVVTIGMTRFSTPIDEALDYAIGLDACVARDIEIWFGGSLGAQVAPLVDSQRVRGVSTLEEFNRICRTSG